MHFQKTNIFIYYLYNELHRRGNQNSCHPHHEQIRHQQNRFDRGEGKVSSSGGPQILVKEQEKIKLKLNAEVPTAP